LYLKFQKSKIINKEKLCGSELQTRGWGGGVVKMGQVLRHGEMGQNSRDNIGDGANKTIKNTEETNN
jgi:hypothetical protein